MLLKELQLWIDGKDRPAPDQMAVDEALFTRAKRDGCAGMRCYEWAGPAVTIGYFERASGDEAVPTIRRVTGGGTVFHGDDVTFCLVLPSGTVEGEESTPSIYRRVHQVFRGLLADYGLATIPVEAPGSPDGGPCFVRPVKWDLLDSGGEKILGGALRRSAGSVIYQGSVRLPERFRRRGEHHPGWVRELAGKLAGSVREMNPGTIGLIEGEAAQLTREKYGKNSWNLGKVR